MTENSPVFARERRAISLRRAALCLPLLLLPLRSKRLSPYWLLGGPSQRLIDRSGVDERDLTLCDVASIPRRWLSRAPFVNLALLYVATTLYCYVSRRFAKFYRRVGQTYRREVIRGGTPEIVVWHSDALPLVRALRYVLRGLPTRTICVQHGYFHGPLVGELDGSRSDLVVLYHASQADHFIASGVPAHRLVFSHALLSFSEAPAARRGGTKRRTVWLVGEAWWSHDRQLDDMVFEIYRQAKALFAAAGWRVRYRPHPNDPRFVNRYLALDPAAAIRLRLPISIDDVYVGVASSFIMFCAGVGARACFINAGDAIPNGTASYEVPLVDVDGLVAFAEQGPVQSFAAVYGDRFRLDRLLDWQAVNQHRMAAADADSD